MCSSFIQLLSIGRLIDIYVLLYLFNKQINEICAIIWYYGQKRIILVFNLPSTDQMDRFVFDGNISNFCLSLVLISVVNKEFKSTRNRISFFKLLWDITKYTYPNRINEKYKHISCNIKYLWTPGKWA